MRHSDVAAALCALLALRCSTGDVRQDKELQRKNEPSPVAAPNDFIVLTRAGSRIFDHRAHRIKTTNAQQCGRQTLPVQSLPTETVQLTRAGSRIFNHRAEEQHTKAVAKRHSALHHQSITKANVTSRALESYETHCQRHGIVVKRHCHCLVCRHHCIVPASVGCPEILPGEIEGRKRIACDGGHSQLSDMPRSLAPLHDIAPRWLEAAGDVVGWKVGKIKCALRDVSYEEETEFLARFEAQEYPGNLEMYRNEIRRQRLAIYNRALATCRVRDPTANPCPRC